jgi:hypothetical protein
MEMMGATRYWWAMGIGIVLLGAASTAFAGSVVCTDEESLWAHIKQGDDYLERFSLYENGEPLDGWLTSAYFSGGTGGNVFTYEVSAPQGLYSLPGALSINSAADVLTIAFSSSNVMAVGLGFLVTDTSGEPISGTLAIALNGEDPVLCGYPDSDFIGFFSKDPITQVRLWVPAMMEVPGQAPDDGTGHQFLALADLRVGIAVLYPPQGENTQAVPVPAAVWMGLLLMTGLGAVKLVERGKLGK